MYAQAREATGSVSITTAADAIAGRGGVWALTPVVNEALAVLESPRSASLMYEET